MCLLGWLRPLATTALCPCLCPHRQQEEQSRQPEEPPQPQVDEQLPGLPAWALPAPTTRPGTATTRRQVGAGVAWRSLHPHQASGAPQRAQDPEDDPVLWGQHVRPLEPPVTGMSVPHCGSLQPSRSVCPRRLGRDLRLASCLRRTCPVWLLASGLEMEGCCQKRGNPPRPKPPVCPL